MLRIGIYRNLGKVLICLIMAAVILVFLLFLSGPRIGRVSFHSEVRVGDLQVISISDFSGHVEIRVEYPSGKVKLYAGSRFEFRCTEEGGYRFTVTARDFLGRAAAKNFTFSVYDDPKVTLKVLKNYPWLGVEVYANDTSGILRVSAATRNGTFVLQPLRVDELGNGLYTARLDISSLYPCTDLEVVVLDKFNRSTRLARRLEFSRKDLFLAWASRKGYDTAFCSRLYEESDIVKVLFGKHMLDVLEKTLKAIASADISDVEELSVSVPIACEVGEEVAVRVEHRGKGIEGIAVMVNDEVLVTGGNGYARFTPDKQGIYNILTVGANRSLLAYPRGNKAWLIRGLRFDFHHIVPLHAMRVAGANYVYLKIWYIVDDRANVISAVHSGRYVLPCTEAEQLEQVKMVIGLLKSYNFKVYLVPFLWREGISLDAPPEERENLFYIPENLKDKFLDQLSKVAVRVADFAEQNHVDMISPIYELQLYVGYEKSSEWHQSIIAGLRERYSGKIVVAGHDYMGYIVRGKPLPPFNYSGYDFVELFVNPSETGSWEELRSSLREMLDYGEYLRNTYGVGVIVSAGTFGGAKWIAQSYPENPGKARAELFKIILSECLGRVEGLFFNCWVYGYSVETTIGILAKQGKEPYEVIKSFYSGEARVDLDELWELHIKGEEDKLWKPLLENRDYWFKKEQEKYPKIKERFVEITGPVQDPEGDASADYLNLKELEVTNDAEYVYISISFYSEKATAEVVMFIDVDSDGEGEFHVRCLPSGKAMLYKSTSPSQHEYMQNIECNYNSKVTVKLPLELIGYPEKIGLEIASWNPEKNDIDDDFGGWNWGMWLVYSVQR